METLVKPTIKTWKFIAMQELIINWALDLTALFELHTLQSYEEVEKVIMKDSITVHCKMDYLRNIRLKPGTSQI